MQINHHTKNFNIALIILFLMAFVSCALIMNAHADIVRYYVTPNGSDNNDGSSWSSATTLAGVISKIGNSDWNSDGYEIWLQSGDYTNGNAITISSSSRSGPTDVTIIGGFKGTETSSADRPAGGMSKLTGNGSGRLITLKDGSGKDNNSYAINLTLSNLVISGGITSGDNSIENPNCGGGLYVGPYNTATIKNCAFVNNTASRDSYGDGGHGGAVYCSTSSVLTVENSTFKSNTAIAESDKVTSDASDPHAGGGAIYNSGTTTLTNCTFAGNSVGSSNGRGGAVCSYSDTTTMINCIAWGNTAATGSEIYGTEQDNLSASYCIISGDNSDYAQINVISADPKFSWNSAENYYAIPYNSPAVDAGTSGTAIDQRGISRPQGLSYDIGAYEFVPSISISPDALSLEVGDTYTLAKSTDLSGDTYTWRSSSPAIASVDASSGTIKALSAGTAKITVLGTVSKISADCTITITAKDISKATALAIDNQTYTGSAITPVVTVKDGSMTLTQDTDYTLAYSNNINEGTASITITGKGNYTGTLSSTFAISAKSIADSTVAAIAAQTYTGSAVTPAVTVKDGSTTLASGTDYTLTYSNNTNVGNASVLITGKGNYTGSLSSTFTISAKSITGFTIAAIAAQTYTGSAVTPTVTVKDGSTTLASDTDYTIAYSNNKNVGNATVAINGKGNYTGSLNSTFAISAKSITGFTVAAIAAQTYTGSAVTPAVTVKDGSTTLTQDTDYTLAYSNNKNVGNATVAITGKGNYTGSLGSTFAISAKSVDGLTVAAIAAQTYTGSAVTPAVTVKDGSTTLTQDTDYTLAYSNNINAGTASITITGKGNYTGSLSSTFAISAKSITGFTVAAIAAQTYTGSAVTPAVTVKDGSTTLASGTDYTIAYSNNKNVGNATVAITGKGNYTGSLSSTFAISAKSITGFTVAAIAAQTYTGSAVTPAVTVKDGSTTLASSTDYTLTYSNNTNVGTASVLITGNGNYTGSLSAQFTISAKATTLTLSAISDQTWTGSAITPSVKVYDGATALTANSYTLSYKNNTAVGTATVTATGAGNYAGSSGSTTFRILKTASIDVTEASRTDDDYSGVLSIGNSSTENRVITAALKTLRDSGKLYGDITAESTAKYAASNDAKVADNFYSSLDIITAIRGYWNLNDSSGTSVKLVTVRNTVSGAIYADGNSGLFAKFWNYVKAALTSMIIMDSSQPQSYLPLQANFTVGSADLTGLPAGITKGLTEANFLKRISLFAVVKSGDSVLAARNLVDAASGNLTKYVTVVKSGDDYIIRTRVMLFDMAGTVSGDKTTGAPWVQPLGATSGDTLRDGNYFIVQDGAGDGSYKLCLAFAIKGPPSVETSATVDAKLASGGDVKISFGAEDIPLISPSGYKLIQTVSSDSDLSVSKINASELPP